MMKTLLQKVMDVVRKTKQIVTMPFDVEEKDGASNLVTTVDCAVQQYLKTELSKVLPEADFLGEEDPHFVENGMFWVVDPIDGTSNFVRGMNLSAISVALVENGEGVLGVVYNPFTDEMFYAVKGGGAFLNGTPIRVTDKDLSYSLLFTAFSLYNKNLAEPCEKVLWELYPKCDDFRRLGSAAIELCYIAAGRAELYFEMRVFPWDWAAAGVVLKEAGAFVGTLHQPLRYDKPIILIVGNTEENYQAVASTVLKHVPVLPY